MTVPAPDRLPAGPLAAPVLPDLSGWLAARPRLFGAAPTAPTAPTAVHGRVQPVPTVMLDGHDVAAGPEDGVWPDLMVVDGVSVTWGRDEALAQPEPATARLSLFDPTGEWAAGADIIGREVQVRWRWASTVRTYFAGRITGVEVRQQTVTDPAGRDVEGAMITLAAASLLTDLGNRHPTADPWPAENLGDRRTRIAALATGPVTALNSRPYWWPAGAAPTDNPDNDTVLELISSLFTSSGCDRYSWDPSSRAVEWLARRAFPTAAGLAYLAWDPSLRTGAYIAALGVNRGDGTGVFSDPMFIDSRAVGYDAGVTKDMASRLTRAELTYDHQRADDGTYSATTITKLIPGADEAILGVRAASASTVHAAADWADLCASDLAGMAAGEASGWGMEAMSWDTTSTGGFETLGQAAVLLAGCEQFSIYFLSGSWLPRMGIRPVFGVMGGTIAYRRRGWAVEWINAPVSVVEDQQYELTWDHVDAGDPYTLVWDEDDNPMGMHSSVTWDDLRYVTYGFGVSSLPTDGA